MFRIFGVHTKRYHFKSRILHLCVRKKNSIRQFFSDCSIFDGYTKSFFLICSASFFRRSIRVWTKKNNYSVNEITHSCLRAISKYLNILICCIFEDFSQINFFRFWTRFFGNMNFIKTEINIIWCREAYIYVFDWF